MTEPSAISQADHVINKFGGINATARACGHKNASTVQGWKERGRIPQDRWPEVLEAARRTEVPITLDDFVRHLLDPSAPVASEADAA